MIEIHEWNGEGYKPLVFTPQWMAAILNWQPLYELANADEIEVHQKTDEVFVLWRGRGALYYLSADGELEVQDLQPGVVYNVPAGVWHGCWAVGMFRGLSLKTAIPTCTTQPSAS